MDPVTIASATVAALPGLLEAAKTIIELCKQSGATDEQIRDVLGPAALAEIKRISEQQTADEEAEADMFAAAASRAASPSTADPTSAEGNPAPDGSASLRA